MACRPNRINKKLHQKIGIFATVAPSIYFSIFAKSYSVSFTSDCILDFDIVFGEVINQFEVFVVCGVAVTELTVSSSAIRVEVTNCGNNYPD